VAGNHCYCRRENSVLTLRKPSRLMKLTLYAICVIVMLLIGVGCTTEGSGGAAPSVVTVQYTNPASFTDFSVQGRDVGSSTSIFTREVTRTLVPVMGSRFPGHLLTLQFTNIDLAGRRPAGSSARVVRSHTLIRLSFNYVLRDKSGLTVASGSQRLVDTPRSSPSRSGPLPNETRMLQRWLMRLSVNR
jgi:hypothetical protein